MKMKTQFHFKKDFFEEKLLKTSISELLGLHEKALNSTRRFFSSNIRSRFSYSPRKTQKATGIEFSSIV